jgi:hypothetical protein
VTCRWFSLGTPVSSTNKIDGKYITEILLKVALNTIKQPNDMVSKYPTTNGYVVSFSKEKMPRGKNYDRTPAQL